MLYLNLKNKKQLFTLNVIKYEGWGYILEQKNDFAEKSTKSEFSYLCSSNFNYVVIVL